MRLATPDAFLPSRASIIFALQSPLILPHIYILYPSEWIQGLRRSVSCFFGLSVSTAQPVYKIPLPPYLAM
ncbi:hypothetical protein N7491_000143 [Penicillium cf. griseofulvum]|uniref:Uncharacterized protein n=1 Tax=Penicillium cf. griseofulvum TaxID=2972120 RepID=A0A9W9MEB3_9EURO|nr:hypothetical protein N7472_004504 [Penicillium cf. griseofulvum]KAJ5442066.1 hypothetical protein N7445_005073 [Penicillium cf. griseofulvum]KAJ5450961.1 hypothetical protein N7491_000143 [Penicillium cf. griseofulvum]